MVKQRLYSAYGAMMIAEILWSSCYIKMRKWEDDDGEEQSPLTPAIGPFLAEQRSAESARRSTQRVEAVSHVPPPP